MNGLVKVIEEEANIIDKKNNVQDNQSKIYNPGWITKSIEKFVNSKYKNYLKNPIGWYIAGTYLPGERQKELAKLNDRPKLTYTITSVVGIFGINLAKLYGAYELIQTAGSSEGIIKTIKEAGATGLVLWTLAGLTEVGVRTYFAKNKKPTACMPIELGYRGIVGINKKIKSPAKSTNENIKNRRTDNL